ncbi:CD3324 family protein [Paenibacillus terricola]|nr:CD3324 family protein [Paenibacillus terricola]
MKKYTNAHKVLPDELVKEIQKYIEGQYLYIPQQSRQQWGEGSGIREELSKRNEEIHQLYLDGVPVHKLAEQYNLSQERIRGIIYKKQSL